MIVRPCRALCGSWPRVVRSFYARTVATERLRGTAIAASRWQHSQSLVSHENSKFESSSSLVERDDSHDEDLFRFTRNRFVANEPHEMSSRYIRFDVNELARIAAKAVGSRYCVGIEKLPEGMHNKSVLMTMKDGKQMIAKIPNPNAGQSHFTGKRGGDNGIRMYLEP